MTEFQVLGRGGGGSKGQSGQDDPEVGYTVVIITKIDFF